MLLRALWKKFLKKYFSPNYDLTVFTSPYLPLSVKWVKLQGAIKYPRLLSGASGWSASLWSRRFFYQSWWNPKKRVWNEDVWLVESTEIKELVLSPHVPSLMLGGLFIYLVFSSLHCKQAPGVLFCCTISSKPCMEDNCLARVVWLSRLKRPRASWHCPHHSNHSWLLCSQDSIPASSVCVQPVWAHRVLEGTQGNILGWLFSGTIHHADCLSIKRRDNGS